MRWKYMGSTGVPIMASWFQALCSVGSGGEKHLPHRRNCVATSAQPTTARGEIFGTQNEVKAGDLVNKNDSNFYDVRMRGSGLHSFKNWQIPLDDIKSPDLNVFRHPIGYDNTFGVEKRMGNF